MNKPKLIISSAYASIITTVFVVIIVIWAELYPPLKEWLKGFSGHHWTSKSIFSLLLYAIATTILYFLPTQHGDNSLRMSLRSLLVIVVIGTVTLTLFFTGHYFRLF